MAMTNAAPRVVFGGINDQSRGQLVQEMETFPQHMPLLRLFTQTGPETTTLVSGAAFTSLYGQQTLSRRSPYYNTQSLLAETLLAEGNSFFVKRLRPDDAANPARIILALDIVADRIPKTSKPLSGFDYPDEVGDGEETTEETVLGFRAKLVLIEDNSADIGTQQVVDGSFVANEDGTQSMLYPLFELPASFFGDMGNLLGIRLWAPTTQDLLPFDEATTEAFQTRMYRVQFVRRASASASPTVVRTARGDDYLDISFTLGAYSESSDVEYYAPEVLVQAYEDDGLDSGQSPLYAPFSQLHVYEANLETLQEMIYLKELELNPASETYLKGPGQVDVFTGVDFDGDRLHALQLEGPVNGGLILGRNHTIYAKGGSDGTTDHASYEALVNRENLNFGELGDEYENIAVYPFSVLYDTGLSLEGKYQMMEVLGKRQDLRVIFTPFVEAEGRAPTKAEEISRTTALMARLQAFPESTLYGTGVCRGEIIQQTGRLAGGGYRAPVPQVIDYAQRWAQFAGAGTGILRDGADIDVSPNNHVQLVKDLNVQFFNERTQAELWRSGATYSLSYDRRSQYYPAIRSIYNDDTSVLLSPITVSICTDVMRLVRRVHAELSGNARLTKEQFIERSDNRILELTSGRYSERVEIVPETFFTEADDQRGFSWHCRVTVYANNPRTVMTFELETRRMEDL